MSLAPLRTNELAHACVYTLTAVSMSVVSQYKPKMFYLGACTLTLVNVVFLDATLLTAHSAEPLKKWISVSCLVMSAVFTSILVHAFKVVPLLVHSRNLGQLCLGLGLPMASVGILVPLIRSFYRKSLLDWKQIDDFIQLDRSALYQSWDPFQSLMRIDALFFPNNPHGSIAPETMALTTEEAREHLWKQKFLDLEQMYGFIRSQSENEPHLKQALETEFALCTQMLKFLSADSQIRLTEEIRRFEDLYPQMKDALQKGYIDHEENQKKQVLTEIERQMQVFETKLNDITNSKEFQQLQQDFFAFYNRVRFNLPNQLQRLRAFHLNKMVPFQRNLQREISTKKAEESLPDQNQLTTDFFVIHLPKTGRTKLSHLLSGAPDFQARFEELGIGTLGEFVEKVLGGDTTLIKDLKARAISEDAYEYLIPEEVFTKLKDYLRKQSSIRKRIYSFISSLEPVAASLQLETFYRLTYRAAILFLTLAPVIQNRQLALTGFIIGALCQLPLTRWIVVESGMDRVGAGVFRVYGPWAADAARRPLLPQIRLTETPEMRAYLKTDVFGKMTLLGLELVSASSLLLLSMPSTTLPPIKIGSAIQGFVLGQELFKHQV